MRPFLLFLCFFFTASLLTDCQSQTRRDDTATEQTQVRRNKHKRHHDRNFKRDHEQRQRSERGAVGQVPQKAYDVLTYVRANKRAMDGYVGGRRFGNFENHLPRNDPDGNPIRYQEWDVNPKIKGRNRGTERLVTGSDGRAWYTNDHYNSFVEIP